MVVVRWRALRDDDDPGWGSTRVLYAYGRPQGRELLYIGKADFCTVRQRWNASDKHVFWRALEQERELFDHVPYVGEVILRPGFRLSSQLLGDIESLLIYILEPWGNIQCSESRRCRPGLTVCCNGDWPLRRNTFEDGEVPRVVRAVHRR